MKWKVIYTNTALKNLESLDRKAAQKIVLKIKYFSEQDSPLHFAKALNPPFEDLYRFRIGEHRAIFEIDKRNHIKFLFILHVGHRKNIYE